MKRNLTISTTILVAVFALAAGCEPESNDINMTEDELQSEAYALEKSDGGFTPTNGGLDAIFAEAGEDDADGVTADDDWETPVSCGLGSCPLGIADLPRAFVTSNAWLGSLGSP